MLYETLYGMEAADILFGQSNRVANMLANVTRDRAWYACFEDLEKQSADICREI